MQRDLRAAVPVYGCKTTHLLACSHTVCAGFGGGLGRGLARGALRGFVLLAADVTGVTGGRHAAVADIFVDLALTSHGEHLATRSGGGEDLDAKEFVSILLWCSRYSPQCDSRCRLGFAEEGRERVR